jgi:glycosyltransferase involved in cell wall biosynthesis
MGDSFGGLEMQTVKKAKDAVERGHNAIVACTKSSRVENYAKSLGLETENININIKYIDLFAAWRLSQIFKRHHIDICIVGSTKILSIAVYAKMLSKSKTAVFLFQHMQSGINKKDFFHNYIYKNLDGAIVLTEQMKQMLLDTTIIDEKKIAIIPHGVDSDLFNPDKYNKIECRRKFNLPEDKFIIGYVARIDRHKDQITSIRALAEAKLENAILVFAGSIDDVYKDYYEELKSEIEKLSLSEKVIFLPFTDEVPALMNSFDIFAMPSRSETFGLVIIEAMAAGLPVIAVNSGGVPEIITHNYNGFLFGQSNVKELAEYFRLLYKDENLRKQISENSLKIVAKNYDYKRQTDMFFEVCGKKI